MLWVIACFSSLRVSSERRLIALKRQTAGFILHSRSKQAWREIMASTFSGLRRTATTAVMRNIGCSFALTAMGVDKKRCRLFVKSKQQNLPRFAENDGVITVVLRWCLLLQANILKLFKSLFFFFTQDFSSTSLHLLPVFNTTINLICPKSGHRVPPPPVSSWERSLEAAFCFTPAVTQCTTLGRHVRQQQKWVSTERFNGTRKKTWGLGGRVCVRATPVTHPVCPPPHLLPPPRPPNPSFQFSK